MDIREFIQELEPQQATTLGASPEKDLELMSITSLAISARRIGDALEKLATPQELVVEQTSADEWAAKEKAQTDRDQRTVTALERIATALEVANAAHLSGAQLQPGSPACLSVAQQTANMIASALKKHQPPEGSSKLVKPS